MLTVVSPAPRAGPGPQQALRNTDGRKENEPSPTVEEAEPLQEKTVSTKLPSACTSRSASTSRPNRQAAGEQELRRTLPSDHSCYGATTCPALTRRQAVLPLLSHVKTLRVGYTRAHGVQRGGAAGIQLLIPHLPCLPQSLTLGHTAPSARDRPSQV